jgi:hypothetical protein
MTERPKGYFKVPEDTVYLLLGILRLEKDGIKNPASNIDTAQKELKDCCQSRPVSTLPKGTAPTAEDFDTALKCFGYCGNECKAECNIKSCCIQAGVIAQAARKEGRNEALSDLYRKMIFPVNSGSWDDKTYTDGEWVDAIDDLRWSKQKKEVPE